jgi:hypothetical protein
VKRFFYVFFALGNPPLEMAYSLLGSLGEFDPSTELFSSYFE